MGAIKLGTCSWNYDSWLGLVYSSRKSRAYEYLPEYARKYRTVEIDSWFYKIPPREEVKDYIDSVPEDFSFTCKVPEDLVLTHGRSFKRPAVLIPNPNFLSVEVFQRFLESIEGILPKMDALIFEFEYLNRDKMASLAEFLEKFESFYSRLDSSLPIALEIRNKNYLGRSYFEFLDRLGIMPVFSEKQYLPHVYELYGEFKPLIRNNCVIRLLGGDRKEIEEKTHSSWDAIVEPREDKKRIADMSLDLKYRGQRVTVSVNNHYEGSAPLTIRYLEGLLDAAAEPAGP